MANGYPTADAAGIMTAAQISTDDFDVTGGQVSVKDVAVAADCSVTYTAATSTGDPAVITPASVGTAVISGC